MNDSSPEKGDFLKPLRERFPHDWIGIDVLRGLAVEDAASLRTTLAKLKQRQAVVPPSRKLQVPRVFISHRRNDGKIARRFANIATTQHFDFWLDILDPKLKTATGTPDPDPIRQALTIAIIIETALLNCTHVLAVVTRRTAGSLWVPYEYGRVKSASTASSSASAWLSRGLYTSNTFAEYLRLGPIHRKQLDVEAWMRRELRHWKPWPGSGNP